MTDAAQRPLKVVLGLVWAQKDVYHATVSVTILDTCYVAGDLREGLPKGKVGVPETAYLTFDFTLKGGPCGQIVTTVHKTIDIKGPPGRTKATAYAVVNGQVVGEDTKDFPR